MSNHINSRRSLRRHNDIDPYFIIERIKGLCHALVEILKRLVQQNPVFAKVLAAAISLSTFWDTVDAVRDIGKATYRAFRRLFTRVESYQHLYTGKAILSKLIDGIAKLALVFFKLFAAKKLNQWSNSWF